MPVDYDVVLVSDNLRHRYRFIGGPIETPDKFSDLMAVIGHASISWARLEQHIDAILIHINKADHSSPPLDLFDEDHPPTFSSKIRMFKDYFNKHPALAPYKQTVRDIIKGLKKLAPIRNDLAHGILEHYNPIERRITLNGIRYRRKTKDFLNRHQKFLLSRVEAFTSLTNTGHYALCTISKELFSPHGLEQLRRHGSPKLIAKPHRKGRHKR